MILNIKEALAKNTPNSDLFGSDHVCIFELGKIFDTDGEHDVLVCGVQSKQGYVEKKDKKILDAALQVLIQKFGDTPCEYNENVVLIDFIKLIQDVPMPEGYVYRKQTPDVMYKPFSVYPYITRDIAFWAPLVTTIEDAEKVIRDNAGMLAQRIDVFDRFEKEGRVSYGFRIVFQSYEKTLDSVEADAMMQAVSNAVSAVGFVVR
jgi:hypothetical protein